MGDSCPNHLSFPTEEMLVAFKSYRKKLMFLDTMRDRVVGFEVDR